MNELKTLQEALLRQTYFLPTNFTARKQEIVALSSQEAKKARIEESLKKHLTYEERYRYSAVPLMLMECALLIIDAATNLLKESNVRQSRRWVVRTHEAIGEYRRDMLSEFGGEKYDIHLDECMFMYDAVVGVIKTYKFSFGKELMNKYDLHSSVIDLAAHLYSAKCVLEYAIEFDIKETARINKILDKEGIEYKVRDNYFFHKIIGCVEGLLGTLGLPKKVDSEHIKMCHNVLENKINSLDIFAVEGLDL